MPPYTTRHLNSPRISSKWKFTAIFSRLFRWCFCPSHVNVISTFPKQEVSLKNILYSQKLACSPEVCKDDMKHTLEQAMKKNGLETEIRNIVFHLIRNSIKSDTKLTMQTVSFKTLRNFQSSDSNFAEWSAELSSPCWGSMGTKSQEISHCHEYRVEGSVARATTESNWERRTAE